MNNLQTEFERELKKMLAVDPSPDFQARIRARAFAAPSHGSGWFAPACSAIGVAALAAAVILGVNLVRLEPETAPALSRATVVTIPPSQTERIKTATPEQRPRTTVRLKPTSIRIVAAPTMATTIVTELNAGRIELAPMTELELTNVVQPVPAVPLLSFARLEPINIEPLDLTVRNLGVSQ